VNYALRTAIHEAGHAVAVHVAGGRIKSAAARGLLGGWVDSAADSPVDRIVVLLSGPSAEAVHAGFGYVLPGRRVDVIALSKQHPILAERWRRDLGWAHDDIDGAAKLMGLDTRAAWRHLQTYTTRLVRTRQRAIERVAALLMAAEHEVVQGSEVHAACGRIELRNMILDMARIQGLRIPRKAAA
jgi:hypothetical protein